MESITLNAYAKINLTLDVIGKREDGYHNILSVMQKVSLCDVITVKKIPRGILIDSNLSYLPRDKSNLCYKAAEKYFEAAGIIPGASIYIQKQIPVSAGLAGGSTDAAAVLKALRALYPSEVDISSLASQIGADVAFCLDGKTSLCEGIGDIQTPIKIKNKEIYHLVIAKNTQGLSTPEIYALYDEDNSNLVRPDTAKMISSLKAGDFYSVSELLCNVFEDISIKKRPGIETLKKRMLQLGAANALMSGSGPCVFGLFFDKDAAKKCAESLISDNCFAAQCEFV